MIEQNTAEGKGDMLGDDGVMREISDAEVWTFEETGVVKLERLIKPDIAAELLEAGRKLKERTWRTRTASSTSATSARTTPGSTGSKIRAEPFYSFVRDRSTIRAAQRLMNRTRLASEDVGVRLHDDTLISKPPMEQRQDPDLRKHSPAGDNYHQDTSFGRFTVKGFNLWIALDEVTPDMGPMRYLTGCHKEGVLTIPKGSTVLTQYPKLLDLYELSEPMHYQPGDATVHHGNMIHGSGANESHRDRWCYILAFLPADADTAAIYNQIDGPSERDAETLEKRFQFLSAS